MEIEGKMIVPDPGIYWLLQSIEYAAGYSIATRQVENFFDTYLDTQQRRIAVAGYSCRRRERRDGFMVAIKSLSQAAGAIHHRLVLETESATSLSPYEWPECPARQQVLQIIGRKPLLPILEVEQTRIVRQMMKGKQFVAEFYLDRVSMLVNSSEHIYLDLEIVLRPGIAAETLTALVDYFREEWKLKPQPLSKFERGMYLLDENVQLDVRNSSIIA